MSSTMHSNSPGSTYTLYSQSVYTKGVNLVNKKQLDRAEDEQHHAQRQSGVHIQLVLPVSLHKGG